MHPSLHAYVQHIQNEITELRLSIASLIFDRSVPISKNLIHSLGETWIM